MDTPDEEETHERLDDWFAKRKDAGEFRQFGRDLCEAWESGKLTKQEKLNAVRSWRLTRHYLNGVQKRRERGGDGVTHRFTGDLSMYVPFLDVCVGRAYCENASVRATFPYFLGPTTWSMFHTVAQTAAKNEALIEKFKATLLHFPRIYACPFCRHHMNLYVFRNLEPELYPLEWTLIPAPKDGKVETTPAEKIGAISDAKSLRLFIWKLHNAVSSSIERPEAWYHRNTNAVYTSRFWPSIESELQRAAALKQDTINRSRLELIYGMLEPTIGLKLLREHLVEALGKGDSEAVQNIAAKAVPLMEILDDALEKSQVLKEYMYNPDKIEANPHCTEEEEEYARGGTFC
eukprot:gnl/TRDRNA2_/TRDRNA2_176002_c1_seq2.p1 gnl/TRDRNA2_/TRDRNA2_176002_c1~~gnl/TRDRNA2_/TRDRNA2_176002_c1_seq2.p1  ORF type:complete len:347 (+),score=68.66 gnl/TRDRNA2_/TRDRNA2_176002_c1_seq2:56-1096(+)